MTTARIVCLQEVAFPGVLSRMAWKSYVQQLDVWPSIIRSRGCGRRRHELGRFGSSETLLTSRDDGNIFYSSRWTAMATIRDKLFIRCCNSLFAASLFASYEVSNNRCVQGVNVKHTRLLKDHYWTLSRWRHLSSSIFQSILWHYKCPWCRSNKRGRHGEMDGDALEWRV